MGAKTRDAWNRRRIRPAPLKVKSNTFIGEKRTDDRRRKKESGPDAEHQPFPESGRIVHIHGDGIVETQLVYEVSALASVAVLGQGG